MPSDAKISTIKVEFNSSSAKDERPVSLFVNGEKLMVEEIIDQRPGQDVDYFKVLADDGQGYLLTRDKNNSAWALEKVFQV